MLKLQPNPTFKWPVKFKTPDGEQILSLVFKHMPVEKYAAWWAAAHKRKQDFIDALDAYPIAVEKAKTHGEEAPPMPKEEDFGLGLDEVMDVVVGWEEVDTPFSRESMKTLLANYHDLKVVTISRGWIEGLQQRKLEN
jgi:hypothetical protein